MDSDLPGVAAVSRRLAVWHLGAQDRGQSHPERLEEDQAAGKDRDRRGGGFRDGRAGPGAVVHDGKHRERGSAVVTGRAGGVPAARRRRLYARGDRRTSWHHRGRLEITTVQGAGKAPHAARPSRRYTDAEGHAQCRTCLLNRTTRRVSEGTGGRMMVTSASSGWRRSQTSNRPPMKRRTSPSARTARASWRRIDRSSRWRVSSVKPCAFR